MSLKWSLNQEDVLVDKNSLILSKLGLGEEVKTENVVVDVDALSRQESLLQLIEKDESERRKYFKKDSPVLKTTAPKSKESNSKNANVEDSVPKVEVASVKYGIDQPLPIEINPKYMMQQVSDLLTLMPHRIQELDYFKKSLCTKASGLVLVDCFWFVHCKYFGSISQTHRSTQRSTSRSHSPLKNSRTTTPDSTAQQKMKEEQKHLMKMLSIHFAQFLSAYARYPRDDDMIFAFYHYAIAKAIILAFQQSFLPNPSLNTISFSQRVFRTVTYLFTGIHHSSALHHQVITALFNEYIFEKDAVNELEIDTPFTMEDLQAIENENNGIDETEFSLENTTQEERNNLSTSANNSSVPHNPPGSPLSKNSSNKSMPNTQAFLPSILTFHHPRIPKSPPPIYPSQLKKESMSTSPSRTSTPSLKNARSFSPPLFFETLAIEAPNTTLQHSKSGKRSTSPNTHNNNNSNNNNNNNNSTKLNANNNSLSPDINSVELSRSPTHSFLQQKPPSSVVKREKKFQTFSLDETENSKQTATSVNNDTRVENNDVVPFTNTENDGNFDVEDAKFQLKNMLEGMMKGEVRIPVFWNEYTLISQQIRTRTIFFDAYQTSPLIEEYFDNSLPILKKMLVKRTVPVESEATGESLKYYVNADERLKAQENIIDRYRSVQVESEKRRQKTNTKLHKSFHKINKLQEELLVQHHDLHNFVSKLIKMQAEKSLRESHRSKERTLSFLTGGSGGNSNILNGNSTLGINNLDGLEAIDL
eukprot:TRINITY_DN2142_c0_g1_i1.p1 TRINITY_DN2142_c0_g1~~TRINITY_DN2142_c0_g1_i1.p1  ORF type:complete len:759 (+),score=175.35 TRINITY_DN2142_c0_g1_i1:209-2485(+)